MVKPGYKQTEMGVIPEDWESVALLSKCNLLNGLTYTPDDITDNGLLVLRSSNVQNNNLTFSDNVYVKLSVDDDKLIKKDDIVICVRNGSATLIGKCAKASKDYPITFGAFMAVLRGENNSYIFQLLQQGTIQKHISKNSGATINQITNGDFKTIFVPFPTDTKEQERIAEALSDVDNMISSLEKLIAKKKAVKDGAMAMLLTGRKRMAGFSKEWEFFQFKDTGIEIKKGQTITQKDVKFGNIPVVAGGKTLAYYCDKYNRDGKNITISASGASAGFVNMYSGKIFASDCSTISENEKYNIVFVYNMLKFLQSDIYASQTGGAQPHIHPNDIGELYLYYTFDIEEQNAIASILADMDNEIEALEQKLEKTRQLKQGMMQQLLTGKIRLI